jgi:hypothetical protein
MVCTTGLSQIKLKSRHFENYPISGNQKPLRAFFTHICGYFVQCDYTLLRMTDHYSQPSKKYDLYDSLTQWSEAQAYDLLYLETGDVRYRQLRDQELRRILGDTSSLRAPERKGNSLQDLRLSLRGFEFNEWVKANPKASVSQTAEQLRRMITSDGPQNGRNVDKRFPHPIPR